MHTGTAAERKFVATAANRLKGVGAVSKGEAESAGAMTEEFELGTQLDKLALAATWSGLTPELRGAFIDRYCDDPTIPGVSRPWIDQTAEAMNKFIMGLMIMERELGNLIWNKFWDERAKLIEQGAEDPERHAARTRGQLLRETDLSETLKLTEALNEEGHKLGILSGTLSPIMNRIKNIISPYSEDWRRWINFYSPEENRYVSGLILGPSHKVTKSPSSPRTISLWPASVKKPAWT